MGKDRADGGAGGAEGGAGGAVGEAVGLIGGAVDRAGGTMGGAGCGSRYFLLHSLYLFMLLSHLLPCQCC